MSQAIAFTADKIFTGETWLQNHAVVTEGGVISSLVPCEYLASTITLNRFPGSFIAPSFIDLQIYGAHGRLLAVYPDEESLSTLVKYCREGGASYCMPTVATNEYAVFYKCIDAIRSYWNSGKKGVLGLHIEGPWINGSKRGAHIESLIHSPTIEQVKELVEYGKGVIRIITLAPEICSSEVIEFLQSHDIIISAGHSNATYEEAVDSFDKGIVAVTHLFNAMSPLHHREPGLVGAALDHPRVMASIIPDGYHVDFASVRIAKKIMRERLFVITDAVTETGKGYYPHQLAGDKYESQGILSGSALTMGKAYFNLVEKIGVSREEALRMCGLYPARVVNLQARLGMIREGYHASLVCINEKSGTAHAI